jgi:cell division transport system ATP-binding protein
MIEFRDVSVAFDGQCILSEVTLSIRDGEFISLIGESGVGKTTLLRLLYFDLRPTSGEIIVGPYSSSTIRNSDIPKLRRRIGIAFQDFRMFDDRSVFENVAFPLYVTGVARSDVNKKVLKALGDVGLSHKRDNMPADLSGGEQQRMVIARALVNEPEILLADEPTGNLDQATAAEILEVLKTIHGRGTAVLVASHNLEFVRNSCSRILQLKAGRVSEVPSI